MLRRQDLAIRVLSRDGKQLVDWTVPAEVESEIPEPAKAIGSPHEIDSVESLYLAGLHLEQYRHATREPADYYREALHRDPGDARCNMALGKLLYRRGTVCRRRAAPAAGHRAADTAQSESLRWRAVLFARLHA